jgi:hypothetical protein
MMLQVPSLAAPLQASREAAVKRRAEQIKIQECSHKAGEAKVLPRDRIAYIQRCLDEQ